MTGVSKNGVTSPLFDHKVILNLALIEPCDRIPVLISPLSSSKINVNILAFAFAIVKNEPTYFDFIRMPTDFK